MIQSLPISVALFVVAAVVIAFAGVKMAKISDRLADRTGLGEAVMGAVFLGGSTSLSGIVTSVTAAAGGHAELAVSNAVGGIAAQTTFLAITLRVAFGSPIFSIRKLIWNTLLLRLLTWCRVLY